MYKELIGNLLNSVKRSSLKSISGMDAAFLYIETPTSPMHIGSLAVVEGQLEYETFRKLIASRIHLIPKLRQRLLYVPMSIDYPYWVDDPDFDIDIHLNHIALPQPATWKELRRTAASIFSEPLDQSRPLWSITFVEGLDNINQVQKGSVGIITKIHHVAIDGVAGAGLLSLLFDMSDEAKDIPEPKPFKPRPLPNELSILLNSTMSFAEKPLKLPKLLSETLKASVKMGYLTRAKHMELPTAPFTAPHTPLNGIISARRMWNSSLLSLARIKTLKKIMGTTLNDVLLAICAGALRKYLLEKGQLPLQPLVAMIPISTRSEDSDGDGNLISSMLVQLATNIEDPIERLEAIHENTIRTKTYQGAIGAKTLSNMADVVPFGVANQAARLYSRYKMAEMHNPVFNVTITNVPGPQFPIYVQGHKMLHMMGMAPIVDGMGLIITIFSYNGKVSVSSTSDAKTMPDIDKFSQYIRDSANELEELILNRKKVEKAKKAKVEKESSPETDALFQSIKTYLKSNAKDIKANSGIFQFNITGDYQTNWKVDLNKSPGQVRHSKAGNADCAFTMEEKHFIQLANQELDVQTAFIQGRLKIEGDMEKAMYLGGIISKLTK